MCEKMGFMLLKSNVYGPLTGHIIDVHSIDLYFYTNFIFISQLFLKYTFSCSAERPICRLMCNISNSLVNNIKTTVSQIESHYFFQTILHMWPNLNVALH